MTRGLRLPAALAFVVLGCGKDAPKADALCLTACVSNTAEQAACGCAGSQAQCPTNCHACSAFCIQDTSTDAGVTTCPDCIDTQGMCPTGCVPVG
jgi:hypothetical protein